MWFHLLVNFPVSELLSCRGICTFSKNSNAMLNIICWFFHVDNTIHSQEASLHDLEEYPLLTH